MSDRKCPFCSRALVEANHMKHVRACIYNPDNLDNIKAFMHSQAIDGIACTFAQYKRRCVGKAPSYAFIQSYFASWADFCEWCGLTPPNSIKHAGKKADEWQDILDRVEAEMQETRNAEKKAMNAWDLSCVDRGLRTHYDWRTRTYQTVYVMELR